MGNFIQINISSVYNIIHLDLIRMNYLISFTCTQFTELKIIFEPLPLNAFIPQNDFLIIEK